MLCDDTVGAVLTISNLNGSSDGFGCINIWIFNLYRCTVPPCI